MSKRHVENMDLQFMEIPGPKQPRETHPPILRVGEFGVISRVIYISKLLKAPPVVVI